VRGGQGLPVEAVARHAGTIAYELLCSVSRRVSLETR
jgi:alanine racemase